MRKISTRIVGIVMSLAMVVSILAATNVFAAKASFTAPTSATTIDDKLITVAAHSQAYITPEVLGLTNVTSRSQELPANFATNASDDASSFCLNEAQNMAVLGVFGSDINENPNPYLYNYFYNCYATEKNLTPSAFGTYTLSKDISGSPMNAAATGGYDQNGTTVCASLYLRPDILLGVGPVNGDTTGYTTAIAALPENQDSNKNNDYNPLQYVYSANHVYSFISTLYDLGDAAHDIMTADSTRTVRYGDPQVIAGDVEKYMKGLEAYVIEQQKKSGAGLKTVAVVDCGATNTLRSNGTIGNNQFVLNTKDCSTQPTTNFSRVAEFVSDVSVNLADKLGLKPQDYTKAAGTAGNFFYAATADQIIENSDAVLFADVLSSIPENQGGNAAVNNFKSELKELSSAANAKKVDDIEMMSSTFDCVGSVGANSVENVFGCAYYTAYLYPEYLNQFDVAAYWYQNFYHVNDLSKLQSVMTANFATSSVQSSYEKTYTPDISNYSEAQVEAKIVEGMNYYEKNADSFKGTLIYVDGRTEEATGWNIDWERGIGAGMKGTGDIWVEQLADDNWYAVKNGTVTNEVDLAENEYGWWYIDDNGQVDFNYTGLVENEYGWWYVENGQVRFDYTGIKENEYGWWRIEDGKVNFDFTGLAQNEYGWWYLENGKVNFNYTGIKDNEYGWWRVENGQVIFDAEGVYENEYGWWYVTGGKVDFSYTGVAQNEYGWWRIENGGVNFNYDGIASNQYGTWYIKGGKVQFDYTGRVTVGGTRYNVTNGKVG